MLEITEISAAVKYDIPYVAISRKKVSEELAKKYRIRRMENADFEKLIEALYLMISYLKKDHRNKKINLNLRLINIYKYNCLLLDII